MNLVEISEKLKDYELLDSGDGLRLERVGNLKIIRTEPRAWWKKSRSSEWDEAAAIYDNENKKEWTFKKDFDKEFEIEISDLKVLVKFLKTSKQIGIFPEQVPEWNWITDILSKESREIKVLNLFGYTGLSTLICAKAGAMVTHVDASKTAIEWARENQELSGLQDKPIRWILDDALVFLKREIRRGVKYDAIIMDPPSFGHGPNKNLWKIEKNLMELIECCKLLLSDKPLFSIINLYATELSALSTERLMEEMMKDHKGITECGELSIKESLSNKLLPTSIFSRWRVI